MIPDIDTLITGPQAALPDMLAARERRQALQQELIGTFSCPVISFTLNIPGPVKVFPLAEMTFEEGTALIDSQLRAFKIPVLKRRSIRAHTGNEQFWAADADVLVLKEILCLLEESLSFGRLFDIDVIRPDGSKISRTDLGFDGRKCLLCSQDAFVCSRSRAHTLRELLEKSCSLYEVSATPKPGLVDRSNTGSHRDMDIFTFEASAVSLNHYFEKFALCGMENSHEPFSRIFSRLRSLGIQAEEAMFAATNGVNTHKGLIFALAVMNCSLGYMYANGISFAHSELLKVNRLLVADVLEDFKGVTVNNARTHGERLYAKYGIKGARGEALSGYQTVLSLALPILDGAIARGLSINDAGILTLLHIIAESEDTNIVSRSSYEEMKQLQSFLKKALSEETEWTSEKLTAFAAALDREWIRRNISPGGSADLLALTYFVWLYEREL